MAIYRRHKNSLAFHLQKKDTPKNKKESFIKKIFNYFILIFAAIVLGYALIEFCVQTVPMNDTSMEPLYSQGEKLILDKMVYHFKEIKRNDVVAIRKIGKNNGYDIKRVIGISGDVISVSNGHIVVNGKEMKNSPDIHNIGILNEKITVSQDEYFVIGDNPDESEDSRFINYGNIEKTEIKGKIVSALRR